VHVVGADTNHNRVRLESHSDVEQTNRPTWCGAADFNRTSDARETFQNARACRAARRVDQNGKTLSGGQQNNRVLIYNQIPIQNGAVGPRGAGSCPNLTTFVEPDRRSRRTTHRQPN